MADQVKYSRVTQEPSPIRDVHIVWIPAGLGCDGDSVPITAATQPSIGGRNLRHLQRHSRDVRQPHRLHTREMREWLAWRVS